MNVLLVSPEFSTTFWSWKHLLKFVGKSAAFIPTALLTVAAMLPKPWVKKVIDMNVRRLKREDIVWADYVFIGAMTAQEKSTRKVISLCQELGVPVVLGGHILEVEKDCESFPGVSYFFLGEAEETLLEFLADMKTGRAKRIYKPIRFPRLELSPVPLYELVSPKDYASAMVQLSRGCPYRCTYCSVCAINGRKWRAKLESQFLAELEALYQAGFRGPVQIADDNFVGKMAVTKALMEKIVDWQEAHGWPFEFTIEAPIVIADFPDLMNLMVQAGIKKVFLGLETRNEACLRECKKIQNLGRDLVADVKNIQNHGLIPLSGFIVGFDSDPPTFVQDMIDFIQETGIAVAMVDVLQAQPGTELYVKLEAEGRILGRAVSNTDCYPNFRPVMDTEVLAAGYKKILKTIYSPKMYYERIRNFLRNYGVFRRPKGMVSWADFKAFLRANFLIGLFGGFRVSYYYWQTLATALFSNKWRAFPDVVALQIYGVHFRRVTAEF